ncbi:MAG TPA: DUF4932 domain-containing protein [Candidatus Eisenbacteria bacterium]|nr:DUF4932 domain-containing protein [Candidatus Eisenbacteria bacterium]
MRNFILALAALTIAAAANAQVASPVLKSTRPVVSIRVGSQFQQDAWRLAPEVRPDVYEVDVPAGAKRRVVFITDVDSLGFDIEVGTSVDFVIEHGADRCATRIVGRLAIPAAVFDADYQAAHKGKISIDVPEVYELVNVAIAMTPTGIADSNLVYHHSDYYRDMRAWFDPYRGHPAVAAIEAVLKQSIYRYANIKMDGYSFEFDDAGRIVQSKIYDRTAFVSARTNSLRPFIPALQSFADTSNFREFYRAHRSTYAAQMAFYADTADVEAMRGWLNRQFPGVTPYDSYKIIFSPLVAYSQSATWLESNGFRELQAHVNFPYPQDLRRMAKGAQLSQQAQAILRGEIVFTELNHGYINPEADKYAARVSRAISNRDWWVDPAKGADYYGGDAAFDEYMNWGLVSLRTVDFVSPEEQAALIGPVDQMMVRGRGFPRFAEFDAFLVDLYRNRKQGQTIADLYPQIIAWFEKENAAAPKPAPKPAAK